jgi:hypothetical protein
VAPIYIIELGVRHIKFPACMDPRGRRAHPRRTPPRRTYDIARKQGSTTTRNGSNSERNGYRYLVNPILKFSGTDKITIMI